jgi:hypothetical protein
MQAALSLARSFSLSQRLLILSLVYCYAAATIFPRTFRLVLGQHSPLQFCALVVVIMVAGLLAVTLVEQPSSPFAFMRRTFMDRRAGAAVIAVALIVSSCAFTTFKFEYTQRISFFADPALAALDHAIHFGDPWQWARALLPGWLDYPLFVFYSAVWFMTVIGAVALAAFLPDRALRERYLASFTIGVMVLSSAVRVAGNSAGPIFYDRIHGGDRFAGLMEALQSSPAGPAVLDIGRYLHGSFTTDTTMPGTGIAAMPSLHVAIAFLNALFFAKLGRVAAVLGWSQFGAVLFGSVYFGWHYAFDGYVSIAVMLVLWRMFAEVGRERATL